MGFVHLIPDRARQRILDIASTQFEDGSAYHQYQPLTKKGTLISEAVLTMTHCGSLPELQLTSKKPETTPFWMSAHHTTTMIPKQRILWNTYADPSTIPWNTVNSHKLPLIGRADWNDCLNLNCFSTEPGESFQTFGSSEEPNAESVFIAGMFVRYGKDYVEICRHRGMAEEVALAEEAIADMEKTVLDAGWDGEWFLRAYDHYKNKIGSKECEDGKIYIEPQGFCVMAEIGLKEGNCLKAMESVEKYLDTKYGIVLLQTTLSQISC